MKNLEIQRLLDSLSLDACACSDTNPDGSVYHCNACNKAAMIERYIKRLESALQWIVDCEAVDMTKPSVAVALGTDKPTIQEEWLNHHLKPLKQKAREALDHIGLPAFRSSCCAAEIDPVDMGLSYVYLCRKCMGAVCNRCGFESRLGHSDHCPTSTARG